MEHRMYLGVIQPKTIVLGPKERYIEKGSTINLTCLIQVSEETMLDIDFAIRSLVFQAGPLNLNPSFVFWNYNGKIITYDRERGGTVVISDRGDQTTSSLIISHATPVRAEQIVMICILMLSAFRMTAASTSVTPAPATPSMSMCM